MRVTLGALLIIATTSSNFARADRHPLYKPQKTSGIATYKGQNEVGPVLFASARIDREDTAPKGLITKMTFSRGKPSDMFARAYLPASFGEILQSVKYETRDPKLEFQVWLKDADRPDDSSFVVLKPKHMRWTSASWQDSADGKFHKKLAALPPGTYALTVTTWVSFSVKRPHPKTGVPEWVSDSLSVAKGKLEIVVTR